LISLKESYLFLRNLYGLVIHPFKTVIRIRKKPDWSQTILVLGLPIWSGLIALLVLLFILIGFLFWQPTNEVFVNAIFVTILLILVIAVAVTSYIGFWVGRYLIWKLKINRGRF